MQTNQGAGGDPIRYGELKKLLREQGCYKDAEGTRHEWWYSPITNLHFTVGRHNSEEVKPGTLNRILKDAGLK